MLKWLAGIITTVLTGVLIYWLTEGLNNDEPEPLPPINPYSHQRHIPDNHGEFTPNPSQAKEPTVCVTSYGSCMISYNLVQGKVGDPCNCNGVFGIAQ